MVGSCGRRTVTAVLVHNRMMAGGAVIDGRLITLAEITCPVLAFIGEIDDIGQPASVRGIRRAAPRAEVSEVLLRAGHLGWSDRPPPRTRGPPSVNGCSGQTVEGPGRRACMRWRPTLASGSMALSGCRRVSVTRRVCWPNWASA